MDLQSSKRKGAYFTMATSLRPGDSYQTGWYLGGPRNWELQACCQKQCSVLLDLNLLFFSLFGPPKLLGQNEIYYPLLLCLPVGRKINRRRRNSGSCWRLPEGRSHVRALTVTAIFSPLAIFAIICWQILATGLQLPLTPQNKYRSIKMLRWIIIK